MMSCYKIKYRLEDYETPHYRYYHALTKETALDMFEETRNRCLAHLPADILDVSLVEEKNNNIVSVESDDTSCCNNNCQ